MYRFIIGDHVVRARSLAFSFRFCINDICFLVRQDKWWQRTYACCLHVLKTCTYHNEQTRSERARERKNKTTWIIKKKKARSTFSITLEVLVWRWFRLISISCSADYDLSSTSSVDFETRSSTEPCEEDITKQIELTFTCRSLSTSVRAISMRRRRFKYFL